MITWMVILTVILIVVVGILGYCYSVLREDHRKFSKLLRYDVRDHASKHFFVRQLESAEPYNPYDDTPGFIRAITDEIKYLEEAVDKPNTLRSHDHLEEVVDELRKRVDDLDDDTSELYRQYKQLAVSEVNGHATERT